MTLFYRTLDGHYDAKAYTEKGMYSITQHKAYLPSDKFIGYRLTIYLDNNKIDEIVVYLLEGIDVRV